MSLTTRNAVFAFAFGAPHTLLSNRQIASDAVTEAFRYHALLVCTQLDVKLEESLKLMRFRDSVHIYEVPENPGTPWPTLRLARAYVRKAKDLKCDRVVIAAAQPHVWRCIRDVRMACEEERWRMDLVLGEGTTFKKVVYWYSSQSTQWWTTNARLWWLRETMLRAMPKFLYRSLAS